MSHDGQRSIAPPTTESAFQYGMVPTGVVTTNPRRTMDTAAKRTRYAVMVAEHGSCIHVCILQTIHYGMCDVLIPKSHKIGELGSSWIKRLLTGVDDRLKVMIIHMQKK